MYIELDLRDPQDCIGVDGAQSDLAAQNTLVKNVISVKTFMKLFNLPFGTSESTNLPLV